MQMSSVIAIALLIAVAPALGSGAWAGDANKGAKVFNKCKACHIVEAKGSKKLGPTLAGLFGRKAGSLEGYKFSSDFKAAGEKGLVWTDENFLAYMEGTKAFIGSFIGKKRAKTTMSFAGLKKKSEREDLLAYLKGATK